MWHKKKASYAIVSSNLYGAQRIYETLLSFLPEESLAFFPADELLRAEVLSSSRELMSQRLYALAQLRSEGPHILITHPAALMRFEPSPAYFDAHHIKIKEGDTFSLEKVRDSLLEMGYHRVNKIDQSLQFAIRGDILDVYSVNFQEPVRIEFFGEEVESVKTFDIATQISKKRLQNVDILPAMEMLLTKEEEAKLSERFHQRLEDECLKKTPEEQAVLRPNVERDLEDILHRNYRPALYKYFGFSQLKNFSVFDYFDPEIVLIEDSDSFDVSSSRLLEEAEEYCHELSRGNLALAVATEYRPLERALPDKKIIRRASKFAKGVDDVCLRARPIVRSGLGIAGIVPTIQSYLNAGDKVVVALGDNHQRDTVKSFLDEGKLPFETVHGLDLPKGNIGLSDFSLNSGFELPDLSLAYLSGTDLFGSSVAGSRFSSRFRNATILRSYEDLRPGDYVVHEYNGIGQFVEITTLETDGVHRDYLKLAYAKNEILYVPLEQFRLVRKYSGREGSAPRLSHLFTGEWERKKKKINERVNELADRLIALYGNRVEEAGFAFQPDDELQRRFESEFPYPLTPDQVRSLVEIKTDMEKPTIMDRLLCGDVGFGKTELAFRAAFKAILSGKQVALLCPTTLLCRQHFEVAQARFATFGVRLAQLSRLVPDALQKSVIDGLAKGEIDFVIGTHRLLSKDVVYKNLGLLIVDEEQRFGVEQKEKIKEIKKNVDVLTLSATPIPRTLQMSLVGIRPLSEINTAPERRMPIQTYVTPYSTDVVKELIGRELSRSGQVFYVYNKVASIYTKGNELSRLIPEAKIGIVHGQMEKEAVEETMQRFYSGEINLLICTSIVENGIDVPNANMIIVEDADRFGLSQLYQIKGRVGRGNRIAYAYLMYRPNKDMNEDAQKRLAAISEFTELGSGYKIAQRDLMIRGAGDILGPEQAGFIDSVGLDLYLKLLHEAIENKKNPAKDEPIERTKTLSIDAYIPKNYATDSDKIELYQELESAKTDEEVDAFARKIRDVYGRIPKETSLLILKRKIDLLLSKSPFEGMEEGKGFLDIRLGEEFSKKNGIGIALFEAMSPFLKDIGVRFVDKKLQIRLKEEGEWLPKLHEILVRVERLYREHP